MRAMCVNCEWVGDLQWEGQPCPKCDGYNFAVQPKRRASIQKIGGARGELRFALKDGKGKVLATARAFDNAKAIDAAYSMLIAKAKQLGVEVVGPKTE